MDNLRNGPECGVVETRSVDQHLEGAPVSLVGKFCLKHVEAQLAWLRYIPFGENELKVRIPIDEAPNQPGACHAIDMDALASDPDATAEIIDTGGGHGSLFSMPRSRTRSSSSETAASAASWPGA